MIIVAIDGKYASGKTTPADKLAEICNCNVDDYFLRPEQRTPGGLLKWAAMWALNDSRRKYCFR